MAIGMAVTLTLIPFRSIPVLSYWNAFSPAVQASQPELTQRFADICHSHTDYVWDLGTE